MRDTKVIGLDATAARVDEEVYAPGRRLKVLKTAGVTEVRIRVGSRAEDAVPMQMVNGFQSPEGWERLYISHDAAPGGEIHLLVSELTEYETADATFTRDAQGRAITRTYGTVSDTPYAGQVAVGLVAVPLGAAQEITEVLIQSKPSNTGTVYVGSSAGQYVELSPGQSMPLPFSDLAAVYVRASVAAQTVNYIARD